MEHCLKKACLNKNNSSFYNFSIISPVLAYGGGGGGGGGVNNLKKNKISYKGFNICLEEKGYIKDKNGIFDLPFLDCNQHK